MPLLSLGLLRSTGALCISHRVSLPSHLGHLPLLMHLILLLYLRQLLPLLVQQLILYQCIPNLIITQACQSSTRMLSGILDILHRHLRYRIGHVLWHLSILLRLWLAHLSNRSAHCRVHTSLHLWLDARLVHRATLLLQTLLLLHSSADETLVVHPLDLLHLLQ